MRVFVAGATGALGRPVVRELVRRGHDVVALTRSAENSAAIHADGARPEWAGLFDTQSLIHAAKGADAVLRLATRIPTRMWDVRPGSRAWKENDLIRDQGTKHLAEAARAVGAEAFVQESIVWVARPPDGAPFDEGSGVQPHRITDSAIAAERTAEALTGEGIRAATLRMGLGYGPHVAQLKQWAADLKKRRMPAIGRRDAPLSFIHWDDAAHAFADVLETKASGTFHVVDDRPTSFRSFLNTLARETGAPEPRTVPPWLPRLLMGDYAVRLLTTPMVTDNHRLRSGAGWRPTYPTIEAGLAQVARTWKEKPW